MHSEQQTQIYTDLMLQISININGMQIIANPSISLWNRMRSISFCLRHFSVSQQEGKVEGAAKYIHTYTQHAIDLSSSSDPQQHTKHKQLFQLPQHFINYLHHSRKTMFP